MKKLVLILGMIACMTGLAACGSKVTEDYGITEEQAVQFAETMVENISSVVTHGDIESYAPDEVIYAGLENFSLAMEEMGDFQSVLGHTVKYDDGITIDLEIRGTLRDATFQIILDEEGVITGISTNVIYGFGEMMAKAGLNTLMGMGTVFAVLIIIIVIISGFSLISRLENKKEDEKKAVPESNDRTVEQIMEREEMQDDLELIAVIAAAIAAYEGRGSADNYIVRSIKRRNR